MFVGHAAVAFALVAGLAAWREQPTRRAVASSPARLRAASPPLRAATP